MTPPLPPSREINTGTIASNLTAIRQSMADAAQSVGRDPVAVSLIAVSKFQPVAALQAALAAGHRRFGENRVQEAKAKWPALREIYPDLDLHLIGPLQTNKVREAVALFDVIQTIDRPKLAAALAEECRRQGRFPRCYVQVNTGEEPQKAGIAPADLPSFLTECRDIYNLPIAGLMCIPPAEEEPALHFALLADMARRAGLAELSMGMSSDFEVAIRCSATLVRVGTAIFGERPAEAVPPRDEALAEGNAPS